MRHILLSCLALLSLTACASLAEDPIQEVRFETPGARGSICTVDVDGMLYKVRPPQAVKLPKTEEGLRVDCRAPGNRRSEVFVAVDIVPAAAANIANGLAPGLIWDHGTGGLYRYPDIVTVDFTSIPLRAESLPAHNNPDIRQPEDYDLEEFRPGTPRLNSDRDAVPTELKRRVPPARPAMPGYTEGDLLKNQGQGTAADKAGFTDMLQKLSPAINPAGEKAPAQNPPAPPAFPGQ